MSAALESPAGAVGLSSADRALVLAIARTAIPDGRILDGADEETLENALALVTRAGRVTPHGWVAIARGLDLFARARFGAGFADLPLGKRLDALAVWRDAPLMRHLVRALLAPLKIAHFADARSYRALGCRHAVEVPRFEEPTRWKQQISDGAALEEDLELECDAVVIGTGAGGGPIAKGLAERGFAVLILEEGGHFDRKDFNGRPLAMLDRLYRRSGLTVTVGNAVIPVPVGKTVGGTTTINAGTCLRAPDAVLDAWRAELGVDIDARSLAPYYEEVEEILGVAPSSPAALGKPAVVIARGADALGWSHGPLPRNAPGCDGQGLCVFGCPTEAKRSTNVSYIPAALKAGAQLVTGVKVERIVVEGDAARGVVGTVRRPDGSRKLVRVRARAVVVSCGALYTPVLLASSGLGRGSGELGKNLSIHPASSAFALFDEAIEGDRAVPQGYAVHQFAADGILFEGASAPPELVALSLQSFGPGFVERMEQYRSLLGFGFMIKDRSRGQVRVGRQGEPIVTYRMSEADRASLQRGMGLLCRLMFAAGAREVFPAVAGFERLRDPKEVTALERASLPPRAFDLTAYHPLGTARMGVDPGRSVVGSTHEVHDVLNLYVADGASVPTSLGVNPQLTIMALATRAAEHVARRLERLTRVA